MLIRMEIKKMKARYHVFISFKGARDDIGAFLNTIKECEKWALEAAKDKEDTYMDIAELDVPEDDYIPLPGQYRQIRNNRLY